MQIKGRVTPPSKATARWVSPIILFSLVEIYSWQLVSQSVSSCECCVVIVVLSKCNKHAPRVWPDESIDGLLDAKAIVEWKFVRKHSLPFPCTSSHLKTPQGSPERPGMFSLVGNLVISYSQEFEGKLYYATSARKFGYWGGKIGKKLCRAYGNVWVKPLGSAEDSDESIPAQEKGTQRPHKYASVNVSAVILDYKLT